MHPSELTESRSEFSRWRDTYMAFFAESLRKARPKFESVSSEVMLEIPRPEEPELVYRIYRMDIMGKTPEGPKAIEVNVDKLEPRIKSLPGFGVPIAVSPVVWNGVEFQVTGGLPPEKDLLRWAYSWLDIDDKKSAPHADFQLVIHNVLRPERKAQVHFLSVDFGSASPDALEELLFLLAPSAKSIRLGSDLPDPS